MLVSKPMFKSTLISAFEKAAGESKAVEKEDFTETISFAGYRLLLAEDHPMNAEIVRKLLERKGAEIEHVVNGIEALEAYTSHPAGYYSAILMDERMPVMDGLHATVNIRHWSKEDAKTILIIAMTANAFDENVERSKEAGMDVHIAKPIDPKHHLAALLDKIDSLYTKYNSLLEEDGYGAKYDLGNAQMFIIEGMDKVRRVIWENRKRKLTKHKKLSNHTIIEIDNCSPLEILKLQKNLLLIAEKEEIPFVFGKGKKKPEIQKLYEELEDCGERLMEYKECFEIIGANRNSYSETDLEATFMRMKEDHMMNGQLKAAYNVQIAVENYFIIHGYVSNDRTDYNTLIPVLEKHKKAFGKVLEGVTADSGYCSEKNLLYLKENHISSYIKLRDHEKRKSRAYKEDISKYYNMKSQIFEDEHYYICHDGRELRHIRTESKEQDSYTQTFEVYGCADCSGCEHKARCLYRYSAEKNPDRNKVMKINERWEDLKEESNANVQSEQGIVKRQIRSI